jgi:hypothetical protein
MENVAMRYHGKINRPAIRIAVLVLLMLACTAGVVLAAAQGQSGPAAGRAATPDNFAHYRDTGAGYAFDYPRALLPAEAQGNSDTRVLQGQGLSLRVSTTALGGRSLRALAMNALDDPSAASETRNTDGSVVLVQDEPGAERAVKAIALADERVAVMVVDGASEAVSDTILTSFVPVSAAAADPEETDAEARYRNPELGFSIERPKGAQVSRDGDDSVSFKVLGPDNAAASEISDGFVLTVMREHRPGIATLAEYAEAVRADGAPSADTRRVGDYESLHYSTQSEMGDTVSHWLYRVGEQRQYQVTAPVSGDPGRYRRQIQTMLESLRFD